MIQELLALHWMTIFWFMVKFSSASLLAWVCVVLPIIILKVILEEVL